jgi:peptidoglycan hydrolase-like protein with peptidoglycan-binding domain
LLRISYLQLGLAIIATLAITPAFAATKKHSHRTTATKVSAKNSHTSSRTTKGKHGKKAVAKTSWKSKGQHAISSDRTRQIQQALIREHYLEGEANGEWDARTQAAMRKFQADQGWQTKVLPDSRALIKLGLGPDHSGVLNPETAATSPFQPNAPGGGEKTAVSTIVPGAAVVR